MEEQINDSTCQSLAASIQADLKRLPKFSSKCCIYEVPKSLREVNKQAYTPNVVSIGPLHYKDESLLPMEVHKLKYLQSFLDDSPYSTNLNSCLWVVKDKEAEIREHYANPTIHIPSDEFIRMILVDSVFIIELFRRQFDRSIIKDDQIFWKPCMIGEVARDILLAENQLPFFILKDLYWTNFHPQESIVAPYFTDIVCNVLGIDKCTIQIDSASNEATTYCHFLDFIRSYNIPSDIAAHNGHCLICPTVMQLYEAGVKFRVAKSDASNWTNVHFDSNKRIFTMHKLELDNGIESFLRNLVAFEQCHYIEQSKTYISDYINFLDCLINIPEDVQVLVRAGIIVNGVGSDKNATDLFNSLGEHIAITPGHYYYSGITDQLNKYCNKRWNHYRTTLKNTYFKHPWAVISVIYAAILLVLTLIEVVLAIASLPSAVKKS